MTKPVHAPADPGADPPWLLREIPPDQIAAAEARLPQMYPARPGEWLRIDAVWGAQLAEKARLVAERRDDVIRVLPGAEAACDELLATVLAELPLHGFGVEGDVVLRPDGVSVAVDRTDPLVTLSRLVQEDFCIHQKQGEEHVLTAALVCFPSSWSLAEKIGRPLTRIHMPVPEYDGIAARVQRMFDMVSADRPLWRANLLRHHDPALYHAYTEANPRPPGRADSPYLRSERQTLRRLPRTDAVVFTIHTSVARLMPG